MRLALSCSHIDVATNSAQVTPTQYFSWGGTLKFPSIHHNSDLNNSNNNEYKYNWIHTKYTPAQQVTIFSTNNSVVTTGTVTKKKNPDSQNQTHYSLHYIYMHIHTTSLSLHKVSPKLIED
jgi:hypothetical protein